MDPEMTAARPAPPAFTQPRARLRTLLPQLSLDDKAALAVWAVAHLALFTLAWASAWVYRPTHARGPLWGAFQQWDASFLQNIAAHGYWSGHSTPDSIAFFPGYPIVLAAAHLILRNWILAELVVSAVAGCFAVVSLTRLAGNRRAVVYLLTMPAAVFLMVGYGECLFLAFAIPAWRAGTRGRWKTAALLAAAAGLMRPDGMFLIPALAVMALTGPRGRRLAGAAWACGAAAGPALYEVYLAVTAPAGWNAWRKANQAGWNLHLVTPASALRTTWRAAFGHQFPAGTAWDFHLEIAAVGVMALSAVLFAAWRRWPEFVYCGLAAVATGTQTWYQTGMRTVLILFPLCIALAALEVRRPWVRWGWLGVSLPLAVVTGLLFLAGQWAG